MARVNVYLPDDLAAKARAADLNMSDLVQAAVQCELDARSLHLWLDEVAALPPTGIDDETALEAVRAAKDDIEFSE